jgi:hypothetical protein
MSQPCPCGLLFEDVRDMKFFGAGAVCTAWYADESVDEESGTRRVCNRPLSVHPQRQPSGHSIHFIFLLLVFTS